ncbi:MAG: hypothetical protein ACE3JQ_12625 [Paenisporosarcina sp.]
MKKDLKTHEKIRFSKSLLFFTLTTVSLFTGVSSVLAAPVAVEFQYNGAKQSWTAPKAGKYQLEVWGAQGGSSGFNSTPGMKGSSITVKKHIDYYSTFGKGNLSGLQSMVNQMRY